MGSSNSTNKPIAKRSKKVKGMDVSASKNSAALRNLLNSYPTFTSAYYLWLVSSCAGVCKQDVGRWPEPGRYRGVQEQLRAAGCWSFWSGMALRTASPLACATSHCC